MLRKTIIFVALLFGLALMNIALGQTVDPCQYGCPKEGCPQCDKGGGPIENNSSDDSDDDDSGNDSNDDSDDDSDEDSSGDLPA